MLTVVQYFSSIIIEAVNDHEKLAKGDINAITEHKEMFLQKAFFQERICTEDMSEILMLRSMSEDLFNSI